MPTVTPISDAVKASINDAFRAVPDGKRGALLILADEHGARAMLAANLNGNWKVAVEGSKPWHGPVTGTVAIVGSW
jgi:hypothetical protein